MRARSGVNCGLQTGMVATTKVVVCNYPTASHQMGQQTAGHLRCLRHNLQSGPMRSNMGSRGKNYFCIWFVGRTILMVGKVQWKRSGGGGVVASVGSKRSRWMGNWNIG